MTGTTETGNQNLIVLINEVQATVLGDEASDLLTVLDELNTNGLTNGRVRLLRLNTDLLNDDTLSVRRTSERIALVNSTRVSLVVLNRVPSLVSAVDAQVAGGANSSRLTVEETENKRKDGQNMARAEGERTEERRVEGRKMLGSMNRK